MIKIDFFRINVCSKTVALIGLVGVVSASSVRAITFELHADPAFVEAEAWGSSWGDFNGDRCPDLFVNHHRSQAALYKNNCDGTFKDISQLADFDRSWLDVNEFSDQHGVAWGDVDSDGDQDLFITTGARWNSALLMNEDGFFRDRTVERNVEEDREGRMATWFDYNNNRLLDLFINSGSRVWTWQQNTLDNSFWDSGHITGVDIHARSNYSNLIDLDNKLPLEFIAVTEGQFPVAGFEMSTLPFSEITSSLPKVGIVNDTAVGDFNGDLLSDMVLVKGRLRRNQSKIVGVNLIETWFTPSPGVADKKIRFKSPGGNLDIDMYSFLGYVRYHFGSEGYNPDPSTRINSTTFRFSLDASDPANHGIKPHSPTNADDLGIYFGYDPIAEEWEVNFANGGIYTSAYFVIESSQPVSDLTVVGLEVIDKPFPPEMLVNTGLGFDGGAQPLVKYTVVGDLTNAVSCNGVAPGDFDNDMDLDLYMVCTGGTENLANILYENNGSGEFTVVPLAGGAEGPVGASVSDGLGLADTVSVADYDGDGKLDMYVSNGIQLFPVRFDSPDQLYRNTTDNNNQWIELDLVGTTSNRDGVGAKIYATANGVTQLREQNGGYHRWAQHHQRIHFGLADNSEVDIRIEWPSGIIDNHFGVTAGSLYEVIEGGAMTATQLGPVANDPGVVDPPVVTETVEVERAVYIPQGRQVWVRATSDIQPPYSAVLNVTATTAGVDESLGRLIWNASKQAYQRSFRNIAVRPDCITVTSDSGSSDSLAIEGSGICDGDVVPSIISVNQAIYVLSTQVLWIQASSNVDPEGSDVISVVMEQNQVETELGDLVWRPAKGFYQFTYGDVTSAPTSVTITNQSGGLATFPVRVIP